MSNKNWHKLGELPPIGEECYTPHGIATVAYHRWDGDDSSVTLCFNELRPFWCATELIAPIVHTTEGLVEVGTKLLERMEHLLNLLNSEHGGKNE